MAGQSSAMFGGSKTDVSVLGSQVVGHNVLAHTQQVYKIRNHIQQTRCTNSQDFLKTFSGISWTFSEPVHYCFRNFLGLYRISSGLSQDFLRIFSGLFQDFLRTFSGFSQDILRTFPMTFKGK